MSEDLYSLLYEFEKGLNPLDPKGSKIPFNILGYGEISTVFTLNDAEGFAFKRMPLFNTRQELEDYSKIYSEYCFHLESAGIKLPEHFLKSVFIKNRPGVLFIIQKKHSSENFCHKQIHKLTEKEIIEMFRSICIEINKIWTHNENNEYLKLAIDGQLSNWIYEDKSLLYVDTSTPLYRFQGKEMLNPALILNTAPWFLRWILKLFFLKDVMNRYYDPRSVYIDLAANLYKEQRPDLIPLAIKTINNNLFPGVVPIDEKTVEKYYKEDKLIWMLFLVFRRWDRWAKTKLLRKRYDIILPGEIRR